MVLFTMIGILAIKLNLMTPILKNILAIIAGFIVGGMVNMGLIMLGPSIIPPPAGVDMTTPEGLQAGAHLLTAKHYIMPFLAHALGTLAGAFFAARIAATRKSVFAMAIGIIFLLGGIAAARMIPAPTWFIAMDLLLAYLPMAWLGWKLAGGHKDTNGSVRGL